MAFIAAFVLWFYSYIGGDPGNPYAFRRDNADYYPLLVDGFRAGSLGFLVEPPPPLAKLADPYDPLQRDQAGVQVKHDTTYYKGRYYLYFGVAPAVVLFAPFRVLTGVHFPQNLATVIFCAGGFLCSLSLLQALRRRSFPESGAGAMWWGAIILGLGNLCPAMLARNSVWEVPIASAYFFTTLGLRFFFQVESGGRGRRIWLTGAGLAFGLAVASRPHFVFFCAMLGGFWLWETRRRASWSGTIGSGRWWTATAALFLPIAVIVVGLLAYNRARFDDVLEFGQRYQLAGVNQAHVKLVSTRFFPINFYQYFLAPAQLQRYFPFFEVIRGYPGARPAGYGGAEDPYGVLVNLPCVWLAGIALVLGACRRRELPEIGRWLLLLALAFAGLAGATLCFAWAANRYMVDFLPPLLLLSSVGFLLLDERGRDGLGWKFLRVAAVAAVVWSAVFSVLAAVNHNGIFKAHRPQTFATLARIFNEPAIWWESRHGDEFGRAEVTLRFPMDRPGAAEPVLVTGVSYRSDFLYLLYEADGRHVRLGFNHTNYNQRLSPPIAVDFRVPHTLGISMGSLYPEQTHSFFSGWKPEAVRLAKQRLRVTLDGVPYFDVEQECFETTQGFVTFGENRVSDFIARRFTGEILSTRRGASAERTLKFEGDAFLRLGLVLPEGVTGRREPLVVTGEEGRGDLLFMEYLGANRIRFGLAHGNEAPAYSPILDAPSGQVQVVEASMGSFYSNPSDARKRELSTRVFVRLNGAVAWTADASFYPMGASTPTVGVNTLHLPNLEPAFSGKIVAQGPAQVLPAAAVARFHLAPYWVETGDRPGYGALRLRIEPPATITTAIDPLVVTGPVREQGDYLAINYPYSGQIFFNYLHTGLGGPQTRRVVVRPGQPLTLEVDMPSLYPAETDEYFATRTLDEIAELKRPRLRVLGNGEKLIEATVPYFESAAEQIAVGENRISEVYGRRFSGKILGTERAVFSPPPGLVENGGALELTLKFSPPLPSTPARRERLLATGNGREMDSLEVEYESSQTVRLVVRTASGVILRGTPVAVLGSARRVLRIAWGGLAGSSPVGDVARQTVTATIDGSTVVSGEAEFLFGAPQFLEIGGGVFSEKTFSGQILAVRRLGAREP